jgi:hypothetical protein
MWELFCAFRTQKKNDPIMVLDFAGKDAKPVHKPHQRPLTFEGFQNFLDDMEIISDVTDYFENKDGRYADYIRICSRIKRTIRTDQIEGGMCGIYNPSITQRLNGLVDKQDITSDGQPLDNKIEVEIVRPKK